MKKIIILIVLLSLNCILFCNQDIELEIEFIKSIKTDSWEYYITASNIGPYFIDKDKIAIINDNDELEYINIKNEKITSIIEKDITGQLLKISNSIYIKNNKNNYLLNNGELLKIDSLYKITDNLFFDYNKGIVRNNKVLIKNEIIMSYYSTIVYGPLLSADKNNLFYLKRYKDDPSRSSFEFYQFSISNNREKKVFEDVCCFDFISNNSNLILFYATGGNFTHLNQEFPGDFYIFDINKSKVIYDYDKKSYKNKEEFIINSFDINENNEIIAFGSYMDYSKKVPNNSDSIILLKIRKENEANLSFYKVIINNLRFRENEGIKGKFIKNLKNGELLKLLKMGKSETINGINGTWIKVKTEKGEIGWCFDAYLEEVKE